MKIEKLPSGSYRIRKTYKKKLYTVITDYKPTNKEAIQLIAAELDKTDTRTSSVHMTFEDAANQYLDVKRNVLSPSTIPGYKSNLKSLSDNFKNIYISDMTAIDIQKEINDFSILHAPKTVYNVHGFISAVMGMFRPEFNITTTLPQKKKNETYIPTDEEVKAVLDYARQRGRYEIALLLAACCGLRRSEICALTPSDLSDDNILTINKAMVKDENNNWVVKTTKTTESAREIAIPDFIADCIREKGIITDCNPNQIYNALVRYQNKLGITHFKLHSMRHYFCTKMSEVLPEQDVLELGGWSTPYVMKSVYRHATINKKMEKQKSIMNNTFNDFDKNKEILS